VQVSFLYPNASIAPSSPKSSARNSPRPGSGVIATWSTSVRSAAAASARDAGSFRAASSRATFWLC